jgi:hypothetical protein
LKLIDEDIIARHPCCGLESTSEKFRNSPNSIGRAWRRFAEERYLKERAGGKVQRCARSAGMGITLHP